MRALAPSSLLSDRSNNSAPGRGAAPGAAGARIPARAPGAPEPGARGGGGQRPQRNAPRNCTVPGPAPRLPLLPQLGATPAGRAPRANARGPKVRLAGATAPLQHPHGPSGPPRPSTPPVPVCDSWVLPRPITARPSSAPARLHPLPRPSTIASCTIAPFHGPPSTAPTPPLRAPPRPSGAPPGPPQPRAPPWSRTRAGRCARAGPDLRSHLLSLRCPRATPSVSSLQSDCVCLTHLRLGAGRRISDLPTSRPRPLQSGQSAPSYSICGVVGRPRWSRGWGCFLSRGSGVFSPGLSFTTPRLLQKQTAHSYTCWKARALPLEGPDLQKLFGSGKNSVAH